MTLKDIPIFDLIIILGAIQGLVFTLFLWIKPLTNRKASLFLSLFILSFSLHSLGHIYEYTLCYCSHFIIITFYFFIHFLIYPQHSFSIKDRLLFMPAVFQLVVQCWILFWDYADRQLLIDTWWIISKLHDIIDILAVLMAIFVLVVSIQKIRNYEKALQNNYAEITDFSLSWLYQLIFFLFGVWFLFAIPILYEVLADIRLAAVYDTMWIVISLFIYWIGYSTYFRKDHLAPPIFHEEPKNTVPPLSQKTRSYHQRLVHLMEQEQLYLQPDLNLKLLADKMELSSGYVSQIINQYEQKNFFDFVNSYRVEAVKEKIHNPTYQHLNLLGIALESGFKSKSTFNLAFKKLTGQTPSAYKKGGD